MLQDDCLSHYGIMGQKWGVRRYQNEDGSLTDVGRKRYSDKTINKGTALHRIADSNEKNLQNGFYASYELEDNKKYYNDYGQQLKQRGKNPVDKVLEANKDIKIPGQNTSRKLMKNVLDSSGINRDSSKLKMYLQNDISKEDNASDRLYKRAIKELDEYSTTGKVGKNLYDALNVAHADRNSKLISDIFKKYYKELSKNGYGAFFDMNDIRYGSMKTKASVVVSDANNIRLVDIKQVK